MVKKERVATVTGSVSGFASILGSWQVCHNVCLGLIALLSILGITVTGMPLLFLTKLAIPFWSLAVVLFVVVFYFYKTRHCISKNLLLFNAGLIITGIPFSLPQVLQMSGWVVGGMLTVSGIVLFIREKVRRKKCTSC
jgi:hypothetical protein